MVAHYHEVGDESRFYDRLIWEVPSIAIAIISGLAIAAVYAPKLQLQALLSALAAIWAFSMIVFVTKHQFFVHRQKERLMILEEKCFGMPHLQRSTDCNKVNALGLQMQKPYWEEPKCLERCKAHSVLKVTLWIMFTCLVGLTIYYLIALIIALI